MEPKKKFFSKALSERDFKALSGLWKVDRVILDTLDYGELINETVNTILTELDYLKLGYEIIVLTLVSREKGIIERVSISQTKAAKKALEETPIPFKKIEVPLSAAANLLVKAVNDKRIYVTHDLSDVLYPAGARDIWRRIQKVCGIKASVVYPVVAKNKAMGAMIFSLSKSDKEMSQQEWEVLAGFTNAVGIALENANLYRRLKQANEKLKELDEKKDEFLSVAAHELRAPMTAIRGYFSMILEGDAGEIPPKVTEFLQEAQEGNDRLIRLVNNMLNISRIEEGRLVYQMGIVKLGEVVQTVFDEFKLEAENKGLAISLDINPGLKDQVYVDKDRIYEAVANFVNNAIKYTDKGSVAVKLSQRDQNAVRFEVVDTGRGISQEDQKKLFQKFVRAESSTGLTMGSGLGLYIVKLLIEKFEGKIGFDSKVGKGSTFWFELPIKNNK